MRKSTINTNNQTTSVTTQFCNHTFPLHIYQDGSLHMASHVDGVVPYRTSSWALVLQPRPRRAGLRLRFFSSLGVLFQCIRSAGHPTVHATHSCKNKSGVSADHTIQMDAVGFISSWCSSAFLPQLDDIRP